MIQPTGLAALRALDLDKALIEGGARVDPLFGHAGRSTVLDVRYTALGQRAGFGVGMDGHESVNLVHGETTPLAPGMCFSNEPGIYIPGAFGVRVEDCFHMTAQGPRWFTRPPASIDEPFA
ncbi:hypothetical protein WP12_01335 [Sphingomonas sp. SRS2]|nr:hypothetical protein WP12_01335 [Sphingomonas sp. SRS2]